MPYVPVAALSHFYPHPPRGGRQHRARQSVLKDIKISIHTLREEGDGTLPGAPSFAEYFYPHPPRGGRHGILAGSAARTTISIHTLREEGDNIKSARKMVERAKFLSTPSARRATAKTEKNISAFVSL